MRIFVLVFSFILSGCSDSLAIKDFWNSEQEYISAIQKHEKEVFSESTNLKVLEFSIKRNPTKIESDLDNYIYLKALNINDISDVKDENTRKAMISLGLQPKQIRTFTGIFKVPEQGFNPIVISIRKGREPISNKWTKLIQP